LTLAACAALGLDWRGAFVGVGTAMVGYAIWIATQPLPPPRPASERPPPLTAIWTTLKDPRVLFLALVLGLYGLLDEPLDGFLIADLERVGHLSPALAALPVMAILIGGLTGFGAYERFARALASRLGLIVWALAMTIALAATVLAPWLPLQMAAGFGFGLTGAVFYTALDAQALALRPGQAGATSAVVSTIGMLGVGFPALVGAVADRAGLGAGLAVYAVIPAIIVALLALDR
jgi:predicted MFS family arabinose efflux permease